MSKVSYERAMEISLDQYIIESGISVPESKNSKQKYNRNPDVNLDFYNDGNVMLPSATTDTTDVNNIRNKFRELKISPSSTSSTLPITAGSSGITSVLQKHSERGNDDFVNWKRVISNVNSNKFSVDNILSKTSTNNQNNGKNCIQNNNQKRRFRYRNRYKNRKNLPYNEQSFNSILRGRVERRSGLQQRFNSPSTYFKNHTTTVECSLSEYPSKSVNLGLNNAKANSDNLSTLLSSPNSNSSNLCGSESTKQMMLLLADKVLQAFQNNGNSMEQNQEPKYNKEIQKTIHSMQHKPMIYKCPGGEVLSSDGPGVNLKLTPSATNVSLNHRFA